MRPTPRIPTARPDRRPALAAALPRRGSLPLLPPPGLPAPRGSFRPVEAITDAPHVHDPGMIRMSSELLPQAAGVGVQRSSASLAPELPHRLQQLLLREDAFGRGGQ